MTSRVWLSKNGRRIRHKYEGTYRWKLIANVVRDKIKTVFLYLCLTLRFVYTSDKALHIWVWTWGVCHEDKRYVKLSMIRWQKWGLEGLEGQPRALRCCLAFPLHCSLSVYCAEVWVLEPPPTVRDRRPGRQLWWRSVWMWTEVDGWCCLVFTAHTMWANLPSETFRKHWLDVHTTYSCNQANRQTVCERTYQPNEWINEQTNVWTNKRKKGSKIKTWTSHILFLLSLIRPFCVQHSSCLYLLTPSVFVIFALPVWVTPSQSISVP